MTFELLFSRSAGRFWAAVREDGNVVELRVEDERASLGLGRIVKARVSKVVPGIQSAFLDVGRDRDAFLHAADLVLPGEIPAVVEPDDEPPALPGEADEDDGEAGPSFGRPRRTNAVRAPIEQRVAAGRDILVQVAREAIGTKGARVTGFVTLPGRYLVFTPLWPYRGVSRRIVEPEERARLREILAQLPKDAGGFIVRTAGRSREKEAFEADAAMLIRTWRAIQDRAATTPAPATLHVDESLPLRMLRDAPREGVDRVVFDDEAIFERARSWLAPLDPVLASRLSLHPRAGRLFEAEGVDAELDRALRPRVWLKSGGTIVIEPTEALVSIDVNTGKFVGNRRPEETVLKTNLEAAEEIARQLRLRDLGGIIVIDFIDMDRADSRRQVLAALESALQRDRARTNVVGLSELGLVQLTRKRTRAGFAAHVSRPCPTCHGHGRVKSPETLAGEALAEVRRLSEVFADGALTVRAHPDVARALRLALQDAGPSIDAGVVSRLCVEDDPGARPDSFDVVAS